MFNSERGAGYKMATAAERAETLGYEAYQRWLRRVIRHPEFMETAISPAGTWLEGYEGWRYAGRAYQRKVFRRIMTWCGVLTDEERDAAAMTPEYEVAVVEHRVIAVYHRVVAGSGGALGMPRELPLPAGGADSDRLLRRLARTAVRAVYALGLDFGLVRIVSAPRGRLAVRGVDPFPASMPEGLAGKFAAALAVKAAADRAAQHVSTTDVILGLDVEFVLTTSRGELVPADRFLPRSGAAGHDAAVFGGSVVHALAELRPAPSGEPRQLLTNLQRAMREAAWRITDPALEWRAGGSPAAGCYTGGHIHLSGVPLTFELLRKLDDYLALPLSLLEDPRCLARRPTFGWLGNARLKPHGGFEYRTPASWLVSPIVTRGVIALAKLIAAHGHLLTAKPSLDLRIQRAYYEGRKEVLREWIPLWRHEIKQTPSYASLAMDLEPFIHLIESGWTWNEDDDIRSVWRIPGFSDLSNDRFTFTTGSA